MGWDQIVSSNLKYFFFNLQLETFTHNICMSGHKGLIYSQILGEIKLLHFVKVAVIMQRLCRVEIMQSWLCDYAEIMQS